MTMTPPEPPPPTLQVCGRIILLADPSTSTKPKDRKMMIDGGVFDELSLCIRKYVDFPDVQYQACRAIAAVGKNADAKVQKSAANVFHAFHAAIERVGCIECVGAACVLSLLCCC